MILIAIVLVGLVLVACGILIITSPPRPAGQAPSGPERWPLLIAGWTIATALGAGAGIAASFAFAFVPALAVLIIFWSPVPAAAEEVAELITVVGCALIPSASIALGQLLALWRHLWGLWPTMLMAVATAWINSTLLFDAVGGSLDLGVFFDAILRSGLLSAALLSAGSWAQILWPRRPADATQTLQR
jgi:hypothetical protein